MPASAWRAIGSVIVAAAILGPPGSRLSARPSGQLIPGPVKELATGKILIAQRDLPDPNFTRTVVLIVELNNEGTVGLILNRRSDVTLASVFETLKPHEGSCTRLLSWRPGADRRRDRSAPRGYRTEGHASRLWRRLRHLGARAARRHGGRGRGPESIPRISRYAGWSPGQLERETAQGSWRVLKSVAGTVFDPNPDSLWDRLINQTDGLSAAASPQ